MKAPTLYNLEYYRKSFGRWVHCGTLIYNAPYSLCKGEKIKREAYKAYFEFFKIVKNEKTKRTVGAPGQ